MDIANTLTEWPGTTEAWGFLELLPVAAYACASDGRIVRYNRRAAEIWGREPDVSSPDERYCGSLKLYIPDGTYVPHERCAMADVLRTGVAVRGFEVLVEQPDHRRLACLMDINPLRGTHGEIAGAINCFRDLEGLRRASKQWHEESEQSLRLSQGLGAQLAITRDVTQRKQYEDDLKASEERYRVIVETASDAVVSIDESGTILLANPATARAFGYDPAELIGKPLTVLMPEYLRKVHEAGFSRYLATGQRHLDWRGIELTALRKNGDEFPVEVSFGEMSSRGRKVFTGFIRDISEKKGAEEALRKSEQDLSAIINTIPTFVWSTRPDGFCDFLNQRWLDYAGLTAETARGWGWGAAIHPDDAKSLADYWQQALASGELVDVEARMRRFDGEYRWFLFRANPLRDRAGAIIKWYGTNTDIDDRKRAEEALRANERNFRLMVDTIPALVCTMTPQGEVELVNRQIYEYFGLTLDQLKNWSMIGAVAEEDLPGVVARWRHSVETGEPYDIEHRIRRGDGVHRWFHVRGLPLRDADGRILRWYILLIDVEDRRRAEDALRASERDLSLIIETIPGMVWCAAPDGRTNYLNQRLLAYTGATLADWATAGWTKFLHPNDAVPMLEAWSKAVAKGRAFEIQCRFRRSDGAYRWFHVIGEAARDTVGTVTRWYGLLLDIDDRKMMEEALRATEARLSRATQIATVGELSASIAHEINQPLAAVVASGHACVRFLSAQPPNVARAHEAAESIVRDGKEAGEVVRRIRALFKRTPVEKAMLNVNEVIGEVLLLLASETAKRQVVVETDLKRGLPLVPGDRVQLQQVLLNLLLNGIEAMDSIHVRSRKLSVRSTDESPDTVLVEVRDNGVGLENPDRVFEAFVTTKQNGMGMGLKICRSIVEAHNGRLWAVAAEGPGATFCFTLPVRLSAES